MTEEEIKKLAIEYIDNCTKRAGFVILTEGIKSDFIDLFVAGFMKCLELKACKPMWHKVADELPPTDEFISDYVITDKGLAIYNSRLNTWYLHEKHKWVKDITAWCEIPQFKE